MIICISAVLVAFLSINRPHGQLLSLMSSTHFFIRFPEDISGTTQDHNNCLILKPFGPRFLQVAAADAR